jgi:hypothetical protein
MADHDDGSLTVFYRKKGKWNISGGIEQAYMPGWNEDGPFTRAVPVLAVYATSDYGEMFALYPCPDNIGDCISAVDCLADDFDPNKAENWSFVRRIYGSEAYADNWEEEEFDRMTPDERHHRGYR